MKVTGLRYVRFLNRQHNEFAVRDYMPKCLLDAVILRMKFSKKRICGAQIASLSARKEREASTACCWAAFPPPFQVVRIAQLRLSDQRHEAFKEEGAVETYATGAQKDALNSTPNSFLTGRSLNTMTTILKYI